MPKYTVTGQMVIDYTLEVEAENSADAKDIVELICFVDITDDGITPTNIDIGNNDVDEVESLSQKVWDDTSRTDKTQKLIGSGIDESDAWEIAGEDLIPEEYEGLFSE